jgi:hypothetical protein
MTATRTTLTQSIIGPAEGINAAIKFEELRHIPFGSSSPKPYTSLPSSGRPKNSEPAPYFPERAFFSRFKTREKPVP